MGLPSDAAGAAAERLTSILQRSRGDNDPEAQVRLWLELRAFAEADPILRRAFLVHAALYHLAYENRPKQAGPGPAWVPSRETIRKSNVASLMHDRHVSSYDELHRWSAEHREDFWSMMIERLGIVFKKRPTRVLDAKADVTHPNWLPGARLNIAESCFRADPKKTAIVHGSEGNEEIRRVSYGDLHRLAARVANGLESAGTRPGDRIALYLPMTPESVAIYLGIVLAGRCVVGIADASAPADFEKRIRIAGAKMVFTVEAYLRDGKSNESTPRSSKVMDLGRSSSDRIRQPRSGPQDRRMSPGTTSSAGTKGSTPCLAIRRTRRTSCSPRGRRRIRRRSPGPTRPRSKPRPTPTSIRTSIRRTSWPGRPALGG